MQSLAFTLPGSSTKGPCLLNHFWLVLSTDRGETGADHCHLQAERGTTASEGAVWQQEEKLLGVKTCVLKSYSLMAGEGSNWLCYWGPVSTLMCFSFKTHHFLIPGIHTTQVRSVLNVQKWRPLETVTQTPIFTSWLVLISHNISFPDWSLLWKGFSIFRRVSMDRDYFWYGAKTLGWTEIYFKMHIFYVRQISISF